MLLLTASMQGGFGVGRFSPPAFSGEVWLCFFLVIQDKAEFFPGTELHKELFLRETGKTKWVFFLLLL